jgi:hypothetical protein
MFDPSEVEFATTGNNKAYEVGYQTTAQEAIARLRTAGFTLPVLLESVSAMLPTLALTYARGPAVRRIASTLGPTELFEGSFYDSTTKTYHGRWLDLAALGADNPESPGLSHALQGLYLLALLREIAPADPVSLRTRALMSTARTNARSYRRYTPPPVTSSISRALRGAAVKILLSPPGLAAARAEGPSSEELLEILRDRVVFSSHFETQDRMQAIDKAIHIRHQPMDGRFADPELWALETALSEGRWDGVEEMIDTLEASRKPDPVTQYLRARAVFVAGKEPPRAIAERIAMMALAMPTFVELQLLASEAWNAAGQPDRALLFAGDVLSDSSIDDESRIPSSQLPVALPGEDSPPRFSLIPPASAPRLAGPMSAPRPGGPVSAPRPATLAPVPASSESRKDRTSDTPTLYVVSSSTDSDG